ncbi:MAG: hypothetical protein RR661_07365, partial [Anaerovoracaceae bacterium]
LLVLLGIFFLINKPLSVDLEEVTGFALAAALGLDVLLFFAIFALKHRLIPTGIKSYVLVPIRYLREFHAPLGTLSVGLLMVHFSLTFQLEHWLDFHILTGFFIVIPLILSLCFGLLSSKFKGKKLRTAHIVFSFVAILPFLLHLI